MAIAFVTGQVFSAAGSGTTLTCAFPGSNIAGNLLVYGTCNDKAVPAVTDSRNSVLRATSVADGTNFAWTTIEYVENCGAGANTITVNPGGAAANISISVIEYSGAATSGSLDKVNSGTGFGTAALSAATATTTLANELLIGVTGSTHSGTFLPGGSYTERTDTGGLRSHELEERIVAATAAYTASSTLNASSNWYCLIATFKAAAVGGTFEPAYATASRHFIGVGV